MALPEEPILDDDDDVQPKRVQVARAALSHTSRVEDDEPDSADHDQ